MKNLIVVIALFFSMSSCDEPQQTEQESFIYGSWRLIETYSHPPIGNGWTKVEDGFVIEINPNGNFISTEFTECTNGTYRISDTEISFSFNCDGFTAGYEKPTGTFTYAYSQISDSKIELTPVNFNCFEGCTMRLSKMNNL